MKRKYGVGKVPLAETQAGRHPPRRCFRIVQDPSFSKWCGVSPKPRYNKFPCRNLQVCRQCKGHSISLEICRGEEDGCHVPLLFGPVQKSPSASTSIHWTTAAAAAGPLLIASGPKCYEMPSLSHETDTPLKAAPGREASFQQVAATGELRRSSSAGPHHRSSLKRQP